MVRRNTKQRSIVLDAMHKYKGHPSAEDVYDIVHEDNPSISKATVYRNLQTLADENVIKKLEASGRPEVLYDKNVMLHAHAICVSCGHFIDVKIPEEDELEKKVIPEDDGFLLLSHEVIFKGLCKECALKERNDGVEGIEDREESNDSLCW